MHTCNQYKNLKIVITRVGITYKVLMPQTEFEWILNADFLFWNIIYFMVIVQDVKKPKNGETVLNLLIQDLGRNN